MKILLYLLGGVLIAPGAALTYFIWSVTGAIHQKNLMELLLFVMVRLLDTLIWAMWILLPLVIVWLVLAFLPKYRLIGASAMAGIALVSIVEMCVVAGSFKDPNNLFIPGLSLSGLFLNGWIVWSDASSSPALRALCDKL